MKTIKLPDNFIGKQDCGKLEAFGGHTIAHGRATRWHWGKDADGDDVFEIFRGGENEQLAASVQRDRQVDAFYALDAGGHPIGSGDLEHVMAELEKYFIRLA
ncbi:MAG: hypothetical protein SV598_12490 [Pseudomonadota bacterium]|nr:hypothetical protein [Pseudomonadota bacterium]